MEQADSVNKKSRKRFLYWIGGVFSSLLFWRLAGNAKDKEDDEPAPVKMLTEDGQLVEVDPRVFGKGRPVAKEELQSWVKHKRSI